MGGEIMSGINHDVFDAYKFIIDVGNNNYKYNTYK